MMALLLMDLILAEECLLCKIVKFLMTPQEDDYKLCPTCRGYNVIKRNSLLSSLAKPQRSPLAICFPELGQADSRVQAAWRKLAARQIRIKLTLTHWKTCFKGFILAHHQHRHFHGRRESHMSKGLDFQCSVCECSESMLLRAHFNCYHVSKCDSYFPVGGWHHNRRSANKWPPLKQLVRIRC